MLSAIGAAGAVAVAGCLGGDGDDEVRDPDENDPEDLVGHDHGDHGGHEHDHGSDEELLTEDDLAVFVPPYADAGDDLEELRLVDYGTVASGLETAGVVLESEPDLAEDDPDADAALVAILETVRDGFREVNQDDERDGDLEDETDDGEPASESDATLSASLVATDDGWLRTDELTLDESVAITTLRRARVCATRRVQETGNGDPAGALETATIEDAVGGCALENYADAGEFHDGNGVVDAETMAAGLGMTADRVTSERYEADSRAVGESVETVTLARQTAAALDHYWVDDVGAYDFAYWHRPVGSDGAGYTPSQLGSVVGGQLVVAAVLAGAGETSGRPEDATTAATLLERAETTLERLLESGVVRPWGLPARLEYTADGVDADAETVDVAGCWTFVDRLESGLAIADELAPDLDLDDLEGVAGSIDALGVSLLDGGVVEGHHLDADGHVVTELAYEGGDVTDERTSATALGRFLSGAGRAYGRTDALETSDREAVADVYRQNDAFLRKSFLLESPPETN